MARRTTTKATPAPKAAPRAPVATEPQETTPEKVTLVGRLGADPVLRHTKSGKAVTTIRVAVNAPGAEPTFHSVVVWARTAEVVCEYLRKGRDIEVTGRTQERSYEAADGTERRATEVVAYSVQFGSARAVASTADAKAVA
jgi:single-strand DNA-binding protein